MGRELPKIYFDVRIALDVAPDLDDACYGELVQDACDALDAMDWHRLREIGERALARGVCDRWYRRLHALLSDPVFQSGEGVL